MSKLLSFFGYVTNTDVIVRYFHHRGKGYDGWNFALGMGEYVGRIGLLAVQSAAFGTYAQDQKRANVVAGAIVGAEVGKMLLRYAVSKGYGKVGKKP